jgi:hypothetical protein
MTHHERTTLADRCARCDASTGAPDAQALLAEARAQLEEARQSSEYLHVRWTETAARADGLEEQLADARRERDAMRAAADAAGVRIAELRAELIDSRSDAVNYANAIGLIESTLGIVGSGLLCKTVRAVDDVVKQLADARLSAEQGVRVAEALAEEKAALLTRVGVLEAALRGLRYRDEPDRFCDHGAAPCARCDAARAALEVEP